MAPPKSNSSRPQSEEVFFLRIVIGLALVTGLGSWLAIAALAHHEKHGGIPVDRPRRLAAFALTNQAGQSVSQADFQGQFTVVSFLFTSCSLTCPEVSRRMADIQQLTRGQSDVRLLSLTVDPRTDTSRVLAKWGDKYGADPLRWQLLTGPKTVLYPLITASFLNPDNSDPFNAMPGNFSGTERIALVDPQGRTRMFFNGLDPATPAAVVAEINRLRKE